MASYRGWETATSLLLAYESLARAHENTLRRAQAGADSSLPQLHARVRAFDTQCISH